MRIGCISNEKFLKYSKISKIPQWSKLSLMRKNYTKQFIFLKKTETSLLFIIITDQFLIIFNIILKNMLFKIFKYE